MTASNGAGPSAGGKVLRIIGGFVLAVVIVGGFALVTNREMPLPLVPLIGGVSILVCMALPSRR